MYKIEDNPFEILDLILTQLKEATEETPKRQNDLFTLDQLTNISNRDRTIIFEKLERDKYIAKRKMPIDKINTSEYDGWYITFEGIIFLKFGGFVKQEEDKITALKTQKQYLDTSENNAFRLNYWTWVLAVCTFLLLCLEVLKVFLKFFCDY